MRFGCVCAVALLGAAQLAGAEGRVVPALRYASREYGVSGSYVKHKDSEGKGISDLTVLGHWGLTSGWGPQLEAEGGYGRHTVDALDSTGQSYSIAANLLMNYSASERFGVFAMIGYGYIKDRADRTVGKVENSTSDGRRFFQYGGGLKWLLVPNVALRVDYRHQTGISVKGGNAQEDRELVLFGIAVFQ